MGRIHLNGVSGAVGTGGMAIDATTMPLAAALTHSNGTPVPTITAPDYMPLSILKTDGSLSEVVMVTAYTKSATSATVLRAQEGTPASVHVAGEKFVHAPTAADLVGDTAWHEVGAAGEPAFQNSWVNYGSGYSTAAFRKLSSGLVMLKGIIKGGANGNVAFILPPGYRPKEDQAYPTSAGTGVNGGYGQIKIHANGNVMPNGGDTTSFVWLSPAPFLAEQ